MHAAAAISVNTASGSRDLRTSPVVDHVAGRCEYRYLGAGGGRPPGGTKVLLATVGGVCVGPWREDGSCLAWSPLPRKGDYTVPGAQARERAPSGSALLLTIGGIAENIYFDAHGLLPDLTYSGVARLAQQISAEAILGASDTSKLGA